MPAPDSKKVGTEACLHLIIVWELKISIVVVLQVEFLPIHGVYKTSAAQQSVVAVV